MTMKPDRQVKSRIDDQVRGQVWDRVYYQVHGQVWDRVYYQVHGQVCGQVYGQVLDQAWRNIPHMLENREDRIIREHI